MKFNILLVFGGTVVGLLLGAVFGGALLYVLSPSRPGADFKSLDDLRQQMVQRDDRDLKPDQGVSLRGIIIPHPSDEIIYTLAPNLDVKFQGVPVRTNSFGMRGPEVKKEKPPGVYRIALLGDSFAFGWGVEEEKIFARVLEQRLTALLKGVATDGRRVEVLNFGVPGYSTFQEAALFAERAAQFQPDAALVYFISNDYGLPFFIRDVESDGKLANVVNYVKRAWRKDTPEVSQQKKRFWKILDPNRALKKLSDVTAGQGVKLFLAINPRSKRDVDRKRLRILRRDKRIQLLDMVSPYKKMVRESGYSKAQLQLSGDPHPSAIKHEILGSILARNIFQKLGYEPAGASQPEPGPSQPLAAPSPK